ncbi:MAG: DUF547 domain-containing protein [Abditibacteriaceae bacterium]
MKKPLLAALVATAFVLPFTTNIAVAAPGDAVAQATPIKYSQGILFPYSLLDEATRGNIDENGNINYFKIKDDPNMAQFIDAIAHADLVQFPTFNVTITDPKTGKANKTVVDHSAELVFWINAYNGSVIYTISQHYPLDSIDKIKDFDTAKTHVIAGDKYSFEELRKKIASFDQRALFTLISGTKGGVLPAKDAYRFTNLNANLDAAVRAFINDPNNITINRLQNKVTLNEYFKLFNDAFKPKNSRSQWAGIRYLISAYTDNGSDQRYLTNSEYEIEFAKVSHDLNEKTH